MGSTISQDGWQLVRRYRDTRYTESDPRGMERVEALALPDRQYPTVYPTREAAEADVAAGLYPDPEEWQAGTVTEAVPFEVEDED
jgi:hypothetical protein